MVKRTACVVLSGIIWAVLSQGTFQASVRAQQGDIISSQSDPVQTCAEAKAAEEERYRNQLLELQKADIDAIKDYKNQLLMCKADTECHKTARQELSEKRRSIQAERNEVKAEHAKRKLEIEHRCRAERRSPKPQPPPDAEFPASGEIDSETKVPAEGKQPQSDKPTSKVPEEKDPGLPSEWPSPYNKLSTPPPKECRPYLKKDWQEFEKCLLLTVEHNLNRLPNLLEGKLEAWGRSDPSYNCYAFAANPYDPKKVWAGPRVGDPHEGDTPIETSEQLLKFFEDTGWEEIPLIKFRPPVGGEERVVLFQNDQGEYTHAAFWDQRGILAKMGEYGVFRFSSLDQMTGPAFGRPVKMYVNAR